MKLASSGNRPQRSAEAEDIRRAIEDIQKRLLAPSGAELRVILDKLKEPMEVTIYNTLDEALKNEYLAVLRD